MGWCALGELDPSLAGDITACLTEGRKDQDKKVPALSKILKSEMIVKKHDASVFDNTAKILKEGSLSKEFSVHLKKNDSISKVRRDTTPILENAILKQEPKPVALVENAAQKQVVIEARQISTSPNQISPALEPIIEQPRLKASKESEDLESDPLPAIVNNEMHADPQLNSHSSDVIKNDVTDHEDALINEADKEPTDEEKAWMLEQRQALFGGWRYSGGENPPIPEVLEAASATSEVKVHSASMALPATSETTSASPHISGLKVASADTNNQFKESSGDVMPVRPSAASGTRITPEHQADIPSNSKIAIPEHSILPTFTKPKAPARSRFEKLIAQETQAVEAAESSAESVSDIENIFKAENNALTPSVADEFVIISPVATSDAHTPTALEPDIPTIEISKISLNTVSNFEPLQNGPVGVESVLQGNLPQLSGAEDLPAIEKHSPVLIINILANESPKQVSSEQETPPLMPPGAQDSVSSNTQSRYSDRESPGKRLHQHLNAMDLGRLESDKIDKIERNTITEISANLNEKSVNSGGSAVSADQLESQAEKDAIVPPELPEKTDQPIIDSKSEKLKDSMHYLKKSFGSLFHLGTTPSKEEAPKSTETADSKSKNIESTSLTPEKWLESFQPVSLKDKRCQIRVVNFSLECLEVGKHGGKTAKEYFPLELRRIIAITNKGSELKLSTCIPLDDKPGSRLKDIEFQFDGGLKAATDWQDMAEKYIFDGKRELSNARSILIILDKHDSKDQSKLIDKYMKEVFEQSRIEFTIVGKPI